MRVELLVDMTEYNSAFIRGAIGESDMKEFQYPNTPWNTYVNVIIGGSQTPVNTKNMRCLDEEYNEAQRLLASIAQRDLVNRLKKAEAVYHVVGPQGGQRGVYIYEPNSKYHICIADRKESADIIQLCDAEQIAYKRISEDEFNKIRRQY